MGQEPLKAKEKFSGMEVGLETKIKLKPKKSFWLG